MSLQPLTTGQLLDKTFTIYRKHFLTFMAIAAVPPLIYNIAMFMFQVSGRAPGLAIPMLIGGFLLLMIYLGSLGVSQAAVTVTVSDVILDRPVSASSAFSRVKGNALRYLGITMGVGVIILLGFIALIIPGIYFTISLSLALVASANENLGFSAALKRSKELVKGERNRIAVIYLLSIVITYTVTFGLTFPAVFAAQLLASTSPYLALALTMSAGFLGAALIAPFALIGFTLAYFDARVKKEAFDLQFMMDSQSSPMAASAGV